MYCTIRQSEYDDTTRSQYSNYADKVIRLGMTSKKNVENVDNLCVSINY